MASREPRPVTFNVLAGSGTIEVILAPRHWSDRTFGPKHESVALITFNEAFIEMPRPGSYDSDQGGPLDQAWAAYNKAEFAEMLTILALVDAEVRNRADNGTIPDSWVPDRNAGCSMCPCTPGLRGNQKITVGGQVVDLHIDDHRICETTGSNRNP